MAIGQAGRGGLGMRDDDETPDVAAASLLGLIGTVVPLPYVQCSKLCARIGGVRVRAGACLHTADWHSAPCDVEFRTRAHGIPHALLLLEVGNGESDLGDGESLDHLHEAPSESSGCASSDLVSSRTISVQVLAGLA